MKQIAITNVLILCSLLSYSQISITSKCNQKDGWMPNGWGSFSITVTNDSKQTIELNGWNSHWNVEGEKKEQPIGKSLAPGEKWSKTEVNYLGQNIVDSSKKNLPIREGKVNYSCKGKVKTEKFSVAIPAAKLSEPTKRSDGEKIAVELKASRFDRYENIEQVIRWMEQTYDAMEDLTGNRPYNAQQITLKESVEHPYWAYAGKEIILNTRFVESTLNDFEKGIVSFGWIHEIGHDFDDNIGSWYIWDGPSAEFQANFKLCYAIEQYENNSDIMYKSVNMPGYPQNNKKERISGNEFAYHSFLLFGDKYLADKDRPWTSMQSDDICSFFMRLKLMYGWELYKSWYATYQDLKKKGFEQPKTKLDKINLTAAILEKHTNTQLLDYFNLWKFPITRESINQSKETYKL